MEKTSRFQKIIGDFGENLVLYLLSKKGFEAAVIDHMGIDIIASNPSKKEIIGISVKSRSRDVENMDNFVKIAKSDFDKAIKACQFFYCIPYFAVVVDRNGELFCYLFPASFLGKWFKKHKKQNYQWKMTDQAIKERTNDPLIQRLTL